MSSLSEPGWEALARDPHFRELVSSRRRFVAIGTALYCAYFVVFLALLGYAKDFMSKEVVGNVNVALVFGLLQFVSTFLIAYLYSRYSNRNIDPLARRLEQEFHAEKGV